MSRYLIPAALLVAALLSSGCHQARQVSPTQALAQSGHVPTVRAAVDGSPGHTGPQELVALYLPLGPFAIKGGLVWDGQPLALNPGPLGPRVAEAQAAECAPASSSEPYTVVDRFYVDHEGRRLAPVGQ